MNKMRIQAAFHILVASALLVVTGCKGRGGDGNSVAKPAGEEIAGRWVAKSLEVRIHGKAGGTGEETLEYDTAERARTMGKKPQLTIIDPTGVYREEVWSLSDSLLSKQSGYWHHYQDSIYFSIEGENARRVAYAIAHEGSRLVFRTTVDYDGDGQRDDDLRILLEKE